MRYIAAFKTISTMRKTIFIALLFAAIASSAQDTLDQLSIKGVPATPWARQVGHIPVFEKYEALAPMLSQDNDTTYVINFWATWCKPCVQEMPYFEQLQREYRDQKIRIIMVSLDFSRQLESRLLPFVTDRKLELEVVALTDSNYNNWIDLVSPEWSGAIPVTLIRKGDKRHLALQEFSDYDELEEIVKGFVNL